ncbi:MAG: PadR family transcriptional regulator [Deferrisomatales bacterium]|nr:PadR family transcriptional regulator [Deferrisomatales bacterium]
MRERRVFEHTLLGLLHEGPCHGYELAAHFGEGGDLAAVGRLAKSQLYALLKSLEAQGLVRGTLREGAGGPARRVFEVTDRGRERFSAWVRRPAGSVRGLRVELLLKLHFLHRLGLPGQADLMDAQAEVLRRRLEHLRARAGASPGIGAWVLALQEGFVEAGLGWLAAWRERVLRPSGASAPPAASLSARHGPRPNRLPGRVLGVGAGGAVARVDVETPGGLLSLLLPRESADALTLGAGSEVTVVVPPGGVILELPAAASGSGDPSPSRPPP